MTCKGRETPFFIPKSLLFDFENVPMSLTRNDRIWLVRVLVIGSLLLTTANLMIFGWQVWNQRRGDDASEETMAMTRTAPEEGVIPDQKTDGESLIRYPIFRGNWKKPVLRKFYRGI